MIGLSLEQTNKLTNELNKILADYSVFYINLRGYHWNLKGQKFLELHAEFELRYDAIFLRIDEVAERVRMLGATPLHSYSSFLEHSSVKEHTNVSDGVEALKRIVEDLNLMIKKGKEIIDIASEIGDDVTEDLMIGFLKEDQKTLWMYSSYLA